MIKTSHFRTSTVLTTALLAALMAASLLLAAKPAHAATFTINTTGDSEDTRLEDNVCDASLLTGNQCTLRAAIEQSNATAGADIINFNIPESEDPGVKTISPDSALPDITSTVTINGYTQPGSSPNTSAQGTNAVLLVELSGTGAGAGADGITIQSSNSVIKGLVINRFGERGVLVSGTGNVVEGNFIGTDPSGRVDRGNTDNGVEITQSNNTIGGASSDKRNLVSGNNGNGVTTNGNDVANNKVEGNLIGTGKDGAVPLGNAGSGVRMASGGDNNAVGGATSGAANTIAFNQANGVEILFGEDGNNESTGNRILRNSIFSNAGLGIDLGDDGFTANDPGDPDIGPNNLQNFPDLFFATASSSSTFVFGTLNSAPNSTFTIQFFANSQKDPSGFGEGQKFLGEKIVSTNANGNASFFFGAPVAVPIGNFATATATDSNGNTSEFSEATEVKQSPPPRKKK